MRMKNNASLFELEVYESNHQIKRTKLHITIQEKRYSYFEFYVLTSTFAHFKPNLIRLSDHTFKPSNGYLREIFLMNVRKHTFLGLILPCIVFSLLSLMILSTSLIDQWRLNLLVRLVGETGALFALFLGLLYLFFALVLLLKIVLLREKILFTKRRRHIGYHHLSHQEYIESLTILNMNLKKDYITFKPLESERLIIRELNGLDVNDYFAFAKDEKVTQYLMLEPQKSLEEAKLSIQNARSQYQEHLIYKLAIEEKSSNTVIGYIGLSRYDLTETTCQIVYAIGQAFWGKGYASEAVKSFITYLKQSGKTCIIAGHVQENQASGNVLLKNGFKRSPERDYQMMIHNELKQITTYIIDERKNNT